MSPPTRRALAALAAAAIVSGAGPLALAPLTEEAKAARANSPLSPKRIAKAEAKRDRKRQRRRRTEAAP